MPTIRNNTQGGIQGNINGNFFVLHNPGDMINIATGAGLLTVTDGIANTAAPYNGVHANASVTEDRTKNTLSIHFY